MVAAVVPCGIKHGIISRVINFFPTERAMLLMLTQQYPSPTQFTGLASAARGAAVEHTQRNYPMKCLESRI